MLWQLLIFAVGLGVLFLGAEWLVRGAATLALKYGIRRLVVGITVVALGTSMPEFVVNFFAALTHEDGIALGNIIGSNICNIALILGTSALILPLVVAPGTLRKEYSIMMAAMVAFYLLALDGKISQWDGLLLVGGLVAFMVFLVIDCKRHAQRVNPEDIPEFERRDLAATTGKKVMLLLGGMVLLAGGARLMVYSAVNIASWLGVSSVVIGLTVVAIGTSLPELAASLVSAMKKDPDMSMGNVLGSNLLNVLFVIGLVSLFRPLTVEPEALSIHFPVMLGFGVLLLPLAWTSYRITRWEGGVLLTGFVGYLVYLVFPYVL
ncbi:MAG: calcium/sodium antiporter [Rhodothermales bacterium]